MPGPTLWRSAWPLRVVWLLVPLLVGPALSAALEDRSRPVQVVGSALAWSLWAATLLATLVPRTATLTVVRIVLPGAAAVALWAAVVGEDVTTSALAVGAAVVAVLVLASPGVSDTFVDGSSYGEERRLALRVPFGLLLGPVPLAWLAVAGGVVTGPLLLAARQWVAGSAALVVGAAAVALGARQLHVLSRRWLVFVPAGVVVHDPLTLTEPLLFPRHVVERVGPATAGSSALDATGGALGLVLEIATREPLDVGVRRGRAREERPGVTAVLVVPTQPATTLEVAAGHRLPVA